MRAFVIGLLLVLGFAVGVNAQEDRGWGPQGSNFTIGTNMGWLGYHHWGRDIDVRSLSPEWRTVFERTAEMGGSSVRIWLFEENEGIQFRDGQVSGLSSRFLQNVGLLINMAEENGVTIYWTFFDGNVVGRKRESVRIMNNTDGAGAAFEETVLVPLLDVLTAKPAQLYGIDLVNEIYGAVRSDGRTGVFGSNEEAAWEKARAFLGRTASFIHERAPGVRLTASAGHHTAMDDITGGRFDGLGLDFYDFHHYSDECPTVQMFRGLSAYARSQGKPIVLGEFGAQTHKKETSEFTTPEWGELQADMAERLLMRAEAEGFAAAFIWSLEDTTDPEQGPYALYVNGEPVESVARIRKFADNRVRLDRWRAGEDVAPWNWDAEAVAVEIEPSRGIIDTLNGNSTAVTAESEERVQLNDAAASPAPAVVEEEPTLRASTRFALNQPLGR
ncbi:hypothetical protein OAX78_00585 [Planctomycetota bacterium]|nr:hypothetical protein [Planctomycetota bacterium]